MSSIALVMALAGSVLGQSGWKETVLFSSNDLWYSGASAEGIYVSTESEIIKLDERGTVQRRLPVPGGEFRLGPRGDIYVNNDFSISVFSPTGQLKSKIGKHGSNAGAFGWAYGDEGEEYPGPTHFVVLESGAVYAFDEASNRIFVFGEDGKFKSVWGNKTWTSHVQGIAVDKNGHLYVADHYRYQIRVFDRATKEIRSFGRGVDASQSEPRQRPGDFIYFRSHPEGPGRIEIGTDGKVYVEDLGGNDIEVFSPEGRPLSTISIKSGQLANFCIAPNGDVLAVIYEVGLCRYRTTR